MNSLVKTYNEGIHELRTAEIKDMNREFYSVSLPRHLVVRIQTYLDGHGTSLASELREEYTKHPVGGHDIKPMLGSIEANIAAFGVPTIPWEAWEKSKIGYDDEAPTEELDELDKAVEKAYANMLKGFADQACKDKEEGILRPSVEAYPGASDHRAQWRIESAIKESEKIYISLLPEAYLGAPLLERNDLSMLEEGEEVACEPSLAAWAKVDVSKSKDWIMGMPGVNLTAKQLQIIDDLQQDPGEARCDIPETPTPTTPAPGELLEGEREPAPLTISPENISWRDKPPML